MSTMSTLNAKTFNQVHWNWPGIVFVVPKIVPVCLAVIWPSYGGVAVIWPSYNAAAVWPVYEFSVDLNC